MKKKEPKLSFSNEKEEEKSILALKTLSKMEGWSIITSFLMEKVKYYRDYLDSGEIKDMAEYHRIIDKKTITEQFINLPEILSEFKQINSEKIQFDPYS